MFHFLFLLHDIFDTSISKMKKISRLYEIESEDFIRFLAYNGTIKLDELNAGIERG